MTNRKLYLLVISFQEKFREQPPSLESYLSSLWALAKPYQHQSITMTQFAEWLEQAFTQEPPPFNSQWLEKNVTDNLTPFENWENHILFQIADLHRLQEAGAFNNSYRYYGLAAPSGENWANFDPFSFLECAVCGMYGGDVENDKIIFPEKPQGRHFRDYVYQINRFGWADF
jgi:hypothetical protein